MLDLTEAEIQRTPETAQDSDPDDPYLEYPPLLLQGKGKPKPAAVLIPLLRENSAWQILFTRRRDDLPEHSGQVAFPGGRTDPGDTSPKVLPSVKRGRKSATARACAYPGSVEELPDDHQLPDHPDSRRDPLALSFTA